MSDISVTTFVNGKWGQNCYFVSNKNGRTLIIDPGSDSKSIFRLVSSYGLTPVAVLNTHAHYDHIGAVSDVVKEYNIRFYLHKSDSKLLKQGNLYKIVFESKDNIAIPELTEDFLLSPDCLVIEDFSINVIHTPGHTSGSVCLLVGNALFSGDTMLPNGPGRTDLPGGDKKLLSDSLARLQALPPSLQVYPGHGQPFALRDFWEKHHVH